MSVMRAVLVLGFTMALASAVGAQRDGGGRLCGGVRLSSPELKGGRLGSTFSATEIVDLDVSLFLLVTSVEPGDYTARARLVTPNGALYEELVLPFSINPERLGPETRDRRVDDHPFGVRVQAAELVDVGKVKYWKVTLRVPIAGSTAVSSGLYGEWTAEGSVDELPSLCIQPEPFTLTS